MVIIICPPVLPSILPLLAASLAHSLTSPHPHSPNRPFPQPAWPHCHPHTRTPSHRSADSRTTSAHPPAYLTQIATHPACAFLLRPAPLCVCPWACRSAVEAVPKNVPKKLYYVPKDFCSVPGNVPKKFSYVPKNVPKNFSDVPKNIPRAVTRAVAIAHPKCAPNVSGSVT